MAGDRLQRFCEALHELERNGDDGPLLSLFSEDAVLSRPEADLSAEGSTDPQAFWAAYRAQFSEISTEFGRTHDAGDLGVLEWGSEGRLEAGRPIRYRGVSLLDFEESGDQVVRFATYYDTAAFLEPEG